MTDTPNFRALCAELTDDLEEWVKGYLISDYADECTAASFERIERARAALAARPPEPLRPIPLSERLPGPEDCLFNPGATIGSCWIFNPIEGAGGIAWWSFEPLEWNESGTHWLPANAIPHV